jgi:hypothetical protein
LGVGAIAALLLAAGGAVGAGVILNNGSETEIGNEVIVISARN